MARMPKICSQKGESFLKIQKYSAWNTNEFPQK